MLPRIKICGIMYIGLYALIEYRYDYYKNYMKGWYHNGI